MLKDWNHDLIHALSEKSDALWRYAHHYKKAAEGCAGCSALWSALEADDQKHVRMIREEVERHIAEKRFD